MIILKGGLFHMSSTTIRSNLDPNTIYQSKNCGEFKFIEEAGYRENACGTRTRMVKIKFIKSGYEAVVAFSDAKIGKVGDPYYPKVFGHGYIGSIKPIEYTKDEYDMWYHMLDRIYNAKNKRYNKYGGAGVTVDPRWYSLENFIHDLPSLPGYSDFRYGNRKEWQLDKDYLQSNIPLENRIYSKDTCCLLRGADNKRMMIVDKDNKSETSSKYYGIYKISDNRYQSRIMIDGFDIFLGTYSNEIAAANMYNHIIGKLKSYDASKFINKVPYMPINTCLCYKCGNHPIALPDYIRIAEIDYYNFSPKNKINMYVKAKGYLSQNKPAMYTLSTESEESRRERCILRYGIEFL